MAGRVGLDRETIINKASQMVDDGGLEGLSMATLAGELGVRTPALYHYFAGLAGVRRALALAGLQELTGRIGKAVMGKAGADAVWGLAEALRGFAQEHPGLYEAASRAPDREDREWQEAGQEVVEIMIRALAAYHLSSNGARHIVRMLRSIVHGSVALERMGGFGQPGDMDETFHGLLEALLDYLPRFAKENSNKEMLTEEA